MASLQPVAPIRALLDYAEQQYRATNTVVQAIGADTAPGACLDAAAKPVLLVVFVGETLRAQNFGLNVYARDTT